MNNKFVIPAVLLALFSSAFSWAHATARAKSPYTVVASTKVSASGEATIKLAFKDSQPKAGVCPYYVKSVHYLQAINVLSVELFQEPCLNDQFGQSEGEFYWGVPRGLQKAGTQVQVLVNQAVTGVLTYDGSHNSFTVTSSN